MNPQHLLLLLLIASTNALAFDPICSRNIETLPITAEIIFGPENNQHSRQAQDALRGIESEVVEPLSSAHGGYLNPARWQALDNLQKHLTPIQRALMRERVILLRYALDIASNAQGRRQALTALRMAQKRYCTLYPAAASNLPTESMR